MTEAYYRMLKHALENPREKRIADWAERIHPHKTPKVLPRTNSSGELCKAAYDFDVALPRRQRLMGGVAFGRVTRPIFASYTNYFPDFNPVGSVGIFDRTLDDLEKAAAGKLETDDLVNASTFAANHLEEMLATSENFHDNPLDYIWNHEAVQAYACMIEFLRDAAVISVGLDKSWYFSPIHFLVLMKDVEREDPITAETIIRRGVDSEFAAPVEEYREILEPWLRRYMCHLAIADVRTAELE